jgi:HEAT repeat protein
MGCAACGGPASDRSYQGAGKDDSVTVVRSPEYWAGRLTDPSAAVRREALSMLGERGRASSSYAPLVVPLLLDPDDNIGFTAAWALANMGIGAHPLLIARLDSRDPSERLRAVYGVGELGPAGAIAIERLRTLSNDPNSKVRSMANWAIDEVMVRRMVADPNMFLKEGLDGTQAERIQAIHRLGLRVHSSRIAIRELISLMADSIPAIRVQAIQALADAGPTALPPLSAALAHRNRAIRRGALLAISRMRMAL